MQTSHRHASIYSTPQTATWQKVFEAATEVVVVKRVYYRIKYTITVAEPEEKVGQCCRNVTCVLSIANSNWMWNVYRKWCCWKNVDNVCRVGVWSREMLAKGFDNVKHEKWKPADNKTTNDNANGLQSFAFFQINHLFTAFLVWAIRSGALNIIMYMKHAL